LPRIALILILIVIIYGCSAVKKEEKSRITTETSNIVSLTNLKESNISNNDFFITRAEIEILNNGEKQKFLASLKFKNPGIYLISLRNKTGIEGARIFISKDTILINDRINKKLYCGSPGYIKIKYGISTSTLPVIIGDFIDGKENQITELKCNNNRSEVSGINEEKEIKYTVDCRERKISETKMINETEGIVLLFSKFIDNNKKHYPQSIKIEDSKQETEINIEIQRIEFNPIEKVDFIPGKDYEKVVLK
jgi:hypothetical protein